MKYAKIVNGVVEQIQPNKETGFVKVSDIVIAGMKKNADGTFSVIPKTILELQTAKLQELTTAYNNANQLDIPYMNTTFQADKASQDLIVSVLSAGSVPTGFFWLDKANNQVAMTYTQLQGLSGAILVRNQGNFVKFQGLKAKVKLAKTQADLNAIVW